MNKQLSTGLLALITATCLLACKPSPAEPAVTAAKPAAASTPDPVAAVAGPATSVEGSAIMAQPLDGSSVEAFEKGVQRVHEEGTPSEAKRLDSAIQYLLVYDLAAKRDKAKLYARLNGKTPNEVVSQTSR